MRQQTCTHEVLAAGALVALLTLAPAGAGASVGARSGPPLQADPGALAAALHCPETFDDARHEPVLLVHGTYATGRENYAWNYIPALEKAGWDVCFVDLPGRSTGDIQDSSEYVVFAIREIGRRSGERVDVLGHSQGGLQPRWALKWWPDVRERVDDLVMLATPNHGTAVAGPAGVTRCHPSCMQMRPASAFLAALNADDETPGSVSYTSVYTLTDELVQPQAPASTSALDGAANVLVQDLCPGRPVTHVSMAVDAAVYAVVIDAFTHPGPFDRSRFPVMACREASFAGSEPQALFGLREGFSPPSGAFQTADEPPLRSYARAGGGDSTGAAGAGRTGRTGRTSTPPRLDGGPPAPAAGAVDGDARGAGQRGDLPATGAPWFLAPPLSLLAAARLVRLAQVRAVPSRPFRPGA